MMHRLFPEYDILDDGRVFRVVISARGQNNVEIMGRILRPSGYRQFKLVDKSGRQRFIRAGRLILESFVGPAPTRAHEAAHGDGNRLNNALSNLRWATHQENEEDKRKHGTLYKGDAHPSAKLTFELAAEIRGKYTRKRGEITALSREYGVGRSLIGYVVNGQRWAT